MIIASVLTGCRQSKEKAILEFGIHFGEMVQNEDAQGIKSVYPDVGTYTGSHLKFYRDKIDIFEEGEDKYKVRYGDGAYIIVKIGVNDAMEVVSSQGIFDFTPQGAQGGASAAGFVNGHNVLNGSFNFNGGKFPFSITFNYDAASGTISGAVYYAAYNGGGARNSISSMTLTSGGRELTVSGPSLHISASGSPGSYSGYMTRGNHSGTCTLWR